MKDVVLICLVNDIEISKELLFEYCWWIFFVLDKFVVVMVKLEELFFIGLSDYVYYLKVLE